MALPIAPYDPSRVSQQFGDIVPSMYGPDSRISVTPTGASFTVMQGQDGHITRVKVRATHHLLSFVLMKMDPANDLLDELFRNDVDSLLPSGIVKYQLTDNNGTSKVTAAYAWITQPPDLTYTAAGDLYTWTAVLASADARTRSLSFLP